MLLQMGQDYINSITLVFCRATVGTAPPEGACQSAHGGAYVFQLGGLVRWFGRPDFSAARFFPEAERPAQLGKESRPSGQPVGDGNKPGVVFLDRLQNPAQLLERLAD
jgi:hypothetical protein